MTITIECTPKELADAVLKLQDQMEKTIYIGPERVALSVQSPQNTSMSSDG